MKPSVASASAPAVRPAPFPTFLGYLIVILMPLLLALLVMAAKFQGLQTPVAWDHAQLARHLAAGNGFVTDAVRPLSLSFVGRVVDHPDMVNAPVHPLFLALVFRVLHPSDRVTALAGLLLWVMAVWLTFGIARRWFGRTTAVLAAVFFGANVAALTNALAGRAEPLALLGVLLVFWLVLQREQPVSAGRGLLAGLFCGAVVLTDYVLITLVIVIGWYLMAGPRVKAGARGWFGLGFLLVTIPWSLRNLIGVHRSIFGLAGCQLLANTRSFAGDAPWRLMTRLPGPTGFAFEHPLELAVKAMHGLWQLVQQTPATVNPVVGFLVLTSLPVAMRSKRMHALALISVTGLVLTAFAASLTQPEPEPLLVWLPLLAIVAAAGVVEYIQQHFRGLSFSWLRLAESGRPGATEHLHGRRRFGQRNWGRGLAYIAVVSGAILPLVWYLFFVRVGPEPRWRERLEAFNKLVPMPALVVTDEPAVVAWYGKRPAVGLPQQESDWDRMETLGGPVTVIYITPRLWRAPVSNFPDWWVWLVSPHGIYRGLTPVDQPLGAVVRVRPAAPTARALALEEAVLAAEKNPRLAEAQTELGHLLLARHRLREASDAFRNALALDADNIDAVFGVWQIASRLNDPMNLSGIAQHIARLDYRDQAAWRSLEEAAKLLERGVAARPRDAWLQVNAALCQAKLGQFRAAAGFCQQAAANATPVSAARLLGEVLLQAGRLPPSITELEHLTAAEPDNAVAHEALARAWAAHGDTERALDEFAHAGHLRPGWPLPWVRAGVICLRVQDGGRAVTFFTEAAQWAPFYLPAQLGLAEARQLRGPASAAIAVYEKILLEYPDQIATLNNLAFLYTQPPAKLDRAVSCARHANELDPRNAAVKDTLGWVLYCAGKTDEAFTTLEQAGQLAPANGLVHFHLAQVHGAAGRHEAAQESFRTALLCGLPPTEHRQAEAALAPK